MKMIVGSIMVEPSDAYNVYGSSMNVNAETEVTDADNFESEILPNPAIKEDGTPLKVAILLIRIEQIWCEQVTVYSTYLKQLEQK